MIKNNSNKKIFSFILFSIIILSSIQFSSATILTSSVSMDKVFKCGNSIISATFNDAGIVSVLAILYPLKAVSPMIPGSGRVNVESAYLVTIPLSWNGTYYIATFNSNSSMLWGTRTISYYVNNGVTTNIYNSSTTLFIYNDATSCTGTGKNSYQNYSFGIGNYTNKLAQEDMDLLTWSIYPWLVYWGYLFYVIVLFTVVVSIYMKTQNVMPVLYTIIVFLLLISASSAIPLSFRSPILALIALCLGVVFYRLFTRE